MCFTVRQYRRQCCCGSAAAGRREAETLRERQAAACLSHVLRLLDKACAHGSRYHLIRRAGTAHFIYRRLGALASLWNAMLSPTQGVAKSKALTADDEA